jgi:hypothetical protein
MFSITHYRRLPWKRGWFIVVLFCENCCVKGARH